MRYRTIVLATLYLLPAAAVFAQSPGMESVYFGGGSPWHMFADRLLYVLFALAVAIGIMAAIIKWGRAVHRPEPGRSRSHYQASGDGQQYGWRRGNNGRRHHGGGYHIVNDATHCDHLLGYPDLCYEAVT